MTLAGWVTFVAVCGFVWGGFTYLLVRAFRSERSKTRAASELETP